MMVGGTDTKRLPKFQNQIDKHCLFDQFLTQPIHHITESSKILANLLHTLLQIENTVVDSKKLLT